MQSSIHRIRQHSLVSWWFRWCYIFLDIWFDKRFLRRFCFFQFLHEFCCHDCFSFTSKFDWRQNSFFRFNKLWWQSNKYKDNYVSWKNEETNFDLKKIIIVWFNMWFVWRSYSNNMKEMIRSNEQWINSTRISQRWIKEKTIE